MNRGILLLLGLALAAGSARAGAPALKAGSFEPPRPAPDFTLAGSDGKPLRLGQHRGKVVVLGFGFTSCLAVCPVTMATLRAATRKLGAQAGQVQVIYITVDPQTDTPARMRQWLSGFDPRFLGGSGSEAQLAAVRKAYGVAAEEKPGPDGAYSHSSFVYLIDRQGRLRALMPFGHPAEDFVHDLRILLAAR